VCAPATSARSLRVRARDNCRGASRKPAASTSRGRPRRPVHTGVRHTRPNAASRPAPAAPAGRPPVGRPPGARQPGRHRALVEPQGREKRLRRAPVVQQGSYEGHWVGRRAQPVEGRPRSGRERSPARVTHLSLFPLAPHSDVPRADWPSGRAGRVVTELALRVHRARPLRPVDRTRQSEHPSVDPPLQIPPTTVEGGWYRLDHRVT
jgi:hypothetical protein